MPAATPNLPQRLASIDAYRGAAMFLMMAEVLNLPRLARQFPESLPWRVMAFHTDHVAWSGCSLHDLIQPSFSFLVGVSLPFSLASRQARGQSFWQMLWHALARGLLLSLLGIFLRSVGQPQTNFVFTDTLTQIGLGYSLLFLLAWLPPLAQWCALGGILLGYWALFAGWPLPGPEFNYAEVGVPESWPHHFTGLAAHWNKNSHPAWMFDTWWMNLFPRPAPFTHNPGGYCTLNFIPTLATMLLGTLGGQWLLTLPTNGAKLRQLLLAAGACLFSGWLLGWLGLCPVVKRIWTPAFVLFSGGWCFLFLAAFFTLNDYFNCRWPVYPLLVIGANSITAYCLVHLMNDFVLASFRTHFGGGVFSLAGPAWTPLLEGTCLLVTYGLILWWMFRQRVFVRI